MAVPDLHTEFPNDLHVSFAICQDKWHCTNKIFYHRSELEKDGNKTQVNIFNLGNKKYNTYIPSNSPFIKIIPPRYNQIPEKCFTPIEIIINTERDISKYETSFFLINDEENEQYSVDVFIEIIPDKKK